MKITKTITAVCIACLTIFVTGCQTTIAPAYDYTALNSEKPKSILVLPPTNNTVDVTATYSYLSTVSQPIAEKGYYVFPVSVIDSFLKENGLPTPAEMNAIPLDKISEHIGADAVLYVNITDWGQKYVLLSSKTVARGQLQLVSTKTGNLLWDAHFNFEQASDSGGNGLVGALVNAVVTQIIGSINDPTPQIARVANNIAFNQKNRGLLPGPYYVAPERK